MGCLSLAHRLATGRVSLARLFSCGIAFFVPGSFSRAARDTRRRGSRALASSVAIALLAAGAPATMARAAETQTALVTPTGTLHGTLLLPERQQVSPLALIVAGSGPTNRDGSNPLGVTVEPYRLLAQALAARGIASVRYDKRGIAASASAPLGTPATFTRYVDDVVAWVRQLRGDPRFSRVVIVGHSEGSLLAMLAAAKVTVDGVVSLEGAGRPAAQVIAEQMKDASMSAGMVERAQEIGAAIRAGKDPGDVPSDLVPLFPPYLRIYEQQWFSDDPAAAAHAFSAPLLVVQGGADVQIGVADAHRIADAHSGAALRVFPQMTHVLVDASSSGRMESLATYTDPSLPLDAAMVDAVAAFIRKQPLPPAS